MLGVDALEHAGQPLDARVEAARLVLAALPAGARDLALHLLQLELDVVQQLLLPHNLLVQVRDANGEVLVLALSAADAADHLALVAAQLKQLLAALELLLLQGLVLLDGGLQPQLLSLKWKGGGST